MNTSMWAKVQQRIASEFPAAVKVREVTSFRHFVMEFHLDAHILYAKAYADDVGFEAELSSLRLLAGSDARFELPHIVALYPELRTIVQSRVEGIPVSLQHMEPATLRELCECMQSLFSLKPSPDFPAKDYVADLNLYEANIAGSSLLSRDDQARALNVASTLKEKLAGISVSDGFVHGDMSVANVLYDRTSGRFGLIDFENAHRGDFAYDIARLVWRLFDNDEVSEAHLCQCLEESMPMRGELQQRIDAFRLLTMLGSASYFAWQGYKSNYSFHVSALNYIRFRFQF